MGHRKQKIFAAVLIILALVAAATGAVYAWLSATSGPVTNTFTTAPDHTASISENFDTQHLIKENVAVDVGEPGYAVYVRVAIVATWQKTLNDGTTFTHWKMPVPGEMIGGEGDYYMVIDSDWFAYGGYYYLKEPITGGTTPVLFQRCYQMAQAPDTDYKLHVEIIAQTIQALGTTDDGDIPAVTDAWGVAVDSNGNLKDPTT